MTGNPLRLRPLTVEEYAAASRAVKSKAGWLLKDHEAELDAELAAERAELEAKSEAAAKETRSLRAKIARAEKALAGQAATLAEWTEDIERGEARLKAIRTRRATIRDAVRKAEGRLAAAEEDLPKYQSRAKEAEAELARMRTRIRRAEAQMTRLDPVEDRIADLRAADPATLDEAERHLLALDEEVAAHHSRRDRADHDLAA
jgi:chromosome segregation ATPase